jgi:hypothetical protein
MKSATAATTFLILSQNWLQSLLTSYLQKLLNTSMMELIRDCLVFYLELLLYLSKTPHIKQPNKLQSSELGGQISFSQKNGRFTLNHFWAILEDWVAIPFC